MNFQPWQQQQKQQQQQPRQLQQLLSSDNNNNNNINNNNNNNNNLEMDENTSSVTAQPSSNSKLLLPNNLYPFTNSGALSQFNEDVSSAVLALVQVKAQPQHEQVHQQVQQKISKLARPPELDGGSLPGHIPPQDQLLQQMESHRQMLLNRQQQQPSILSQPLPLQHSHPQIQQLPDSHIPQQSSPFHEVSPQQDGHKDRKPVDRNGRLLTNTKRAAQNRNAQKLFRLRREQYVKDLEVEVQEAKTLRGTIASLKDENQQLREYIITLQGKLLEYENKGTTMTKDKQQILNGGGGNVRDRFDNEFLQNLSVGYKKTK